MSFVIEEHCQKGMTGDVTQLISKHIVQQLLAFGSFAASSELFSHYFSTQNINPRSSLLLKHVACLGFLFNEILHVPLEFDKDCCRCLVWILWSCLMHWELLSCARELFLCGILPQYMFADICILGLVSSHCAHYQSVCVPWSSHFEQMGGSVCLSLALATAAKNFSPVFIPGQFCLCVLCGSENNWCPIYVAKCCSRISLCGSTWGE